MSLPWVEFIYLAIFNNDNCDLCCDESLLYYLFILPIFISDTKLYHWLGSDRSSIFSGRRFVQMWGQCNSNLWNEVGVIHASGWQKTPNQNSFCSDDGRDWKRYRGKVTSLRKWRNIKSKLYIYWGISDSKYHLVYQRRKGKHLITYYFSNIEIQYEVLDNSQKNISLHSRLLPLVLSHIPIMII